MVLPSAAILGDGDGSEGELIFVASYTSVEDVCEDLLFELVTKGRPTAGWPILSDDRRSDNCLVPDINFWVASKMFGRVAVQAFSGLSRRSARSPRLEQSTT